MLIRLKVVPGASREGVEWLGDLLKVKVRAVPEKGRANAAVEALLAKRLAVPLASVKITAGFGSPLKTVELGTLADIDALRARLREPAL